MPCRHLHYRLHLVFRDWGDVGEPCSERNLDQRRLLHSFAKLRQSVRLMRDRLSRARQQSSRRPLRDFRMQRHRLDLRLAVQRSNNDHNGRKLHHTDRWVRQLQGTFRWHDSQLRPGVPQHHRIHLSFRFVQQSRVLLHAQQSADLRVRRLRLKICHRRAHLR